MIHKTFLILLTLLPFFVMAQETDDSKMENNMESVDSIKPTPKVDHSTMDHTMPMDKTEPTVDVEFSKEISTYKRNAHSQPMLNYGEIPMHDNSLFYVFRANRLEQRFQDGEGVMLWDMIGWIGDDYNKLYLKSEGEFNTGLGQHEFTRAELLYSRNVTSFWDIQAGLRHDFINNANDRNFAVFSLYGLAPYWFEVDASTYISDEGDVSARIEAEFSLLLTQRLILQPRFETEMALQDVQEYNIGSGINSIVFGTRLRYEFTRKFAPYIGVVWTQNIGSTKNMLEAASEVTSKTIFVAGVKLWF